MACTMASSFNASNFREFEDTGHVAVVVAVTETYVRVAEQNFRDVSWRGRESASWSAGICAAAGGVCGFNRH